MAARKSTKVRVAVAVDPAWEVVVAAFDGDPRVTRETGKGFGSGSLKVNGKIFAMMSSKGNFVVKLPKGRVDEMVAADAGAQFDPGHGRRMKEWLVLHGGHEHWVGLAGEACEFVRR